MTQTRESPAHGKAAGLDRISFAADAKKIAQNSHGAQELPAHFPAPVEPPQAATRNGADPGQAYFSPEEFNPRNNGHDRRVADARAVRIEDELARRGIALRGRGSERCGPCPVCRDGDDRFSINIKDQVFNCRKCGGKGRGAIDLVMFLDSSDFKRAVATLAGEPLIAAPSAPPPKKIVVARFDYRDEHGDLLFQVPRVEYQNPDGSFVLGKDGKRKKDFPQWRPDPDRPGEWIHNLGDTRRVLYRLPELTEALAHGRTIIIVEGEAKADLLWEWKIPATCSPMGGKNWKAELYAATLRSADIVVIPDNDDLGRFYLDAVAVSLKGVGASVRVLDLPGLGPKGDIINWAAAGGTREQLDALIDSDARPWAPGERESVNAETPLSGEQEPPRVITFTPYVWRAPATIPMRRWLYGRHYIRKFLSATLAAGGLGKSSLDLVEAIAMAAMINLLGVPVPDRLRVAYWGEDPADEIERRVAAILLHFKIPREKIEGWLFVDSFRNQPLRVASLEKGEIVFPDAVALTKALIESRIDVLILDPFVKTHGVSENDNAAIDSVARKFNDIAESADCSIELAHHVRKASNFGRAEVTADDGRGAGSLKDAARCVRVCNRMTTAEAPAAQVKEKDRKRYFRVDDDGKANMTAPAEAATWFRLVSVPLYNNPADPNAYGDEIGVATSWKLPGVFAGLSTHDLPRVQAAIERGGPWARNVQNKDDWAGIPIAQTLDLDLTDEAAKERVKNLLKAWIDAKALKVDRRPHPKRANRTQEIVVVGNRIEEDLFDET